jgi:hypothetical protein
MAADVDSPDAVSVALMVAVAPAAPHAAVTTPAVVTVATAEFDELNVSPEAGKDLVEPSL